MQPDPTQSRADVASVRARTGAAALVTALRPKQWIKNLAVFAAALFAGDLFIGHAMARAAAAFAIFCAVSSATYLLNDVIDREADRQHPLKRYRAVASGQISTTAAIVLAALLAAAGLGAATAFGLEFTALVLAYLVTTIGYTLYFKHAVILDVMILAVGFVLRVVAGAAVVAVPASEWLLLCTLLLAIFLGLAKRRHELTLLEQGAGNHRRVLAHYSPELLDQMTVIVATAAILCYILYTVWPSTVAKFGSTRLIFTVPFVIYGIFRYFYLVHQRQSGGDPTDSLLTDLPLLVDVLLWVATAATVIYFFR